MEVVGVFVNPTLDEVVKAAEDESLTMLQLHGDEGPGVLPGGGAAHRLPGDQGVSGAQLGRRARAPRRFAPTSTSSTRTARDAAAARARASTGSSWPGAARTVPFVLSGGLDPGNVADAVGDRPPYAVDVASGVESEPGVKDHELMAAFFEHAQIDCAERGRRRGSRGRGR